MSTFQDLLYSRWALCIQSSAFWFACSLPMLLPCMRDQPGLLLCLHPCWQRLNADCTCGIVPLHRWTWNRQTAAAANTQ
jgi:hypothetical protein